MQTASYHAKWVGEKIPASMLAGMVVLVLMVIVGGLGAVFVLKYPLAEATQAMTNTTDFAPMNLGSVSSFAIWPVLACLAAAFVAALFTVRGFKASNVRPPFLCGENMSGTDTTYDFRTLKDTRQTAWAGSYYFKDILTESRVTFWANLLACMILFIMIGKSVI